MTTEIGTQAEISNGGLVQVAASDATVLIAGERGVGHALVARHLHQLSGRRLAPFEEVDCSLPVDRLDVELFGRADFQDSGSLTRGKLCLADGGTILLAEVTELPAALQGKLLQVLQEGSVPDLNGDDIAIDVRVMAATHKDFRVLVEQGRFRQDLYYRLNVLRVNVRPLRQRREDIPGLVRHFLAKYAARYGRPVRELSPQTLRHLVEHPWPGNLSELENLVERIVVLDGEDEERVRDELRASLTEASHMGIEPDQTRSSRGQSTKGRGRRPGAA
jgi:DNA-binding NtrC family response regulator